MHGSSVAMQSCSGAASSPSETGIQDGDVDVGGSVPQAIGVRADDAQCDHTNLVAAEGLAVR